MLCMLLLADGDFGQPAAPPRPVECARGQSADLDEPVYATCMGITANGKSVSRLFVLESNQLRKIADRLEYSELQKYDETVKMPQVVTTYSDGSLTYQWDRYIRAQPSGHNGGECIVSVNRDRMLNRYYEMRSNKFSKQLADDWRPEGDFIAEAEEWPDN